MGEVTARTAQGRVAVSRLPDVRSWLLGGLGLLAAAAAALPAHAQDAPKIIKAHGISTFGDLKYPADFTHLEYVNPDAPKGGEISEWTFGGFDSMNPYSVKGRAAALSSIMYESILAGTADEIGAAYCLLCETLEYPEDRSWVIFNLRPEAKFSDGTPVTAEDVVFSYETFVAKGSPISAPSSPSRSRGPRRSTRIG